jgi:hypothetical protein
MKEELKESIVNLNNIYNELDNILASAEIAWKLFIEDPENHDKKITVTICFAYLIIRACAFKDEYEQHFLKNLNISKQNIRKQFENTVIVGKEFIDLFNDYPIVNLRNICLAHNHREKVSNKYEYRSPTEEFLFTKGMDSPTVYRALKFCAEEIIKTINL